jgi:hypothetical protein
VLVKHCEELMSKEIENGISFEISVEMVELI